MTAYTDREPVVPPPAGSWIRSRLLPIVGDRGARLEPEWDGIWHLATGDIRVWRIGAGNDASARVRCGHHIRIHSRRYDGCVVGDTVVADERPRIEICARCLRYSGDVAAADFLKAARRQAPVMLPE